MNNVVNFPKPNIRFPAQTVEERDNRINEVRNEEIEIIVDNIVDNSMEIILANDYDVGDPKCMNSFILFRESLVALIQRSVGIEHILQDMADDLIVEEPENDEKEVDNDNE